MARKYYFEQVTATLFWKYSYSTNLSDEFGAVFTQICLLFTPQYLVFTCMDILQHLFLHSVSATALKRPCLVSCRFLFAVLRISSNIHVIQTNLTSAFWHLLRWVYEFDIKPLSNAWLSSLHWRWLRCCIQKSLKSKSSTL